MPSKTSHTVNPLLRMLKTTTPPRAVALVVAILAAGIPATLVVTPLAAASANVFTENFDETGGLVVAGWTVTGALATQDSSLSTSGCCSLNVSAQLAGGQNDVAVDHTLNIPFGQLPYRVSFNYRAQAINAWEKPWATFKVGNGNFVQVNFAQGAGKNGISFQTQAGTTASFANYTAALWQRASIYVDPASHIARAEARYANGTIYATSANLSIGPNPTGFTEATFWSDYSGSLGQSPTAMNYDDLRIDVATPPISPTASGTGGPGVGQVTLTWTPPTDDGGAPITAYTIYAGSSAGNETFLTNVTSTGASSYSYTDSGFGNGVWRYYKVSAWNVAGQGTNSSEVALRTWTAPSAPQNLTANPGPGVGQIDLAWSAPADAGGVGASISAYNVYRSLDGTSFTALASTSGNRTFADSNRVNGTTYYYAVSAVNAVGEGPQSNAANSKPGPDRAEAARGLTIWPTNGWTGDARLVNFTYNLTISQCDPGQTCPVTADWGLSLDGNPAAADGQVLATGTSTHPGHAERIQYNVSTLVYPTGQNGMHLLKANVDPRAGSTQWNVSGIVINLDAPMPGVASTPTTPVLNKSSKTGGENIRVWSNYSVMEKQCRSTDSCPVQNDWMILLDGTSNPNLPPDGTILAQGSFSHPAHGETLQYALNQSVYVPPVSPGLHYIRVAVRADNASNWQVSSTLLSGVLFAPPLDNPSYAAHANESYYQLVGTPAWVQGTPSNGVAAHSGANVWGVGLAGAYPALADSTLRVASLNLAGTSTASVSFWANYLLQSGHDSLRAQVRLDGGMTEQLAVPASGPAYGSLVTGESAWTGTSNGWQLVTLDLSPYVGHVVDVDLTFRSDAVENYGYALIDDVSTTVNGVTGFSDDLESHWASQGGWVLAVPKTAPNGGADGVGTNAWSIGAFAPYAADLLATLDTPVIPLQNITSATLSFQSWLHTEYYNDSAHVEVTQDGGQTWRTIEPLGDNPYGMLSDGTRGWSGNSLGYRKATFDFTPYVGAPVQIRFVFKSDGSVTNEGWRISNIEVDQGQVAPYSDNFASRARPTDGFYAYFQTSGSQASFTTPEGKTTTITYTGQTGSGVVAHLTANGVLTARQAVVPITGPVSVSNTSFTVTNPVFANATSEGTWIIHPAAVVGGVGGTQLTIGNKTFDDVSSLGTNEPIDGNGLGQVSASNRATLRWNWQDQTTQRYDTASNSGGLPVENVTDQRLRYETDADGDGYSDKYETAHNSDPFSPASTPWTDDDHDGVPDFLETTRTAATDPFQTTLNSLVNPDLNNEAARRSLIYETSSAQLNDSLVQTDPTDGVPLWDGFVKTPAQAQQFVSSSTTTNSLTLGGASQPNQLAVVIPPDWSGAMIVRYGTGLSAQRSTITYDQFFSTLDAYENQTSLPGSDHFLTRVLRNQLTVNNMTYTLDQEPATSLPSPLGLANFAGIPADGTWTVIRDATTPSVTLTVGNQVLADTNVSGSLGSGGALAFQWSFMNVQTGSLQCLAPAFFQLLGSCTTLLNTAGMRVYGPTAGPSLRGLLGELADEYRTAAYQAASYSPTLVPLPADLPSGLNGWGPLPTSTQSTPATPVLLVGATLAANGDYGQAIPRAFNWNMTYFAPNPKVDGQPHVSIGLEPSDGSTGASTLLIHGAYLATLGFDTTTNLSLVIDANHTVGSTITRADVDGDTIPDYQVRLPHFSPAWVTVNPSGWTLVGDIHLTSANRGWAVADTKYLTYDAGRSPAWMAFTPPSTVSGSMGTVSALSDTDAWLAGGWQGNVSAPPFVLHVTLNSQGTPSVTVFKTFSGATNGQVMRGISALSDTDVWVVGDPGIYHYDGSSWMRFSGAGTHVVQMRSQTDGIAITANGQDVLRWDGTTWSSIAKPANANPATWPSGLQKSQDGKVVWTVGNGQAGKTGYFNFSTGTWTMSPMPVSGNVLTGVGALADKDYWIATLSSSTIMLPTHCTFQQCVQTQINTTGTGNPIGINFANQGEGWMGTSSGHLFHYSTTNHAPTASLTAPSTSDTATTINVDGRASTDPDNDPLTWSWDWGDQTARTNGSTASHHYRNAGLYTLTLTVTDPSGAASNLSQPITVSYAQLSQNTTVSGSFDAPGQADYYQFSVPSGKAILRGWLTGPGTGNFDLFARAGSAPNPGSIQPGDLVGNGATTTEDARATSPASGTWIVEVQDVSGTGSYSLTLGAFMQPTTPTPTTDALPAMRNQAFHVSASTSTDARLAYTVDWGDGTKERTPSTDWSNPGATLSTSHVYTLLGDFTLNVSVQDTNGLAAWSTRTINVRDLPVVSSGAASGVGDTQATLSALLAQNGGYSIVNFSFDYGPTTSYGSSTPTQVLDAATNPCAVGGTCAVTATITGLSTGTTYHARARAWTPAGTGNTTDFNFTTTNGGPNSPSMTVTPVVSGNGEQVSVTGSSSDPDGDAVFYNIAWGDGATGSTGNVPSGTPYNFTHTYTSYGTFTIQVTATDVSGAPKSATASMPHKVVDAPTGYLNNPLALDHHSVHVASTVNISGGSTWTSAQFEYGDVGGGFPSHTSAATLTSAGQFNPWIGSLADAHTYQYHLVVCNEHGCVTGPTSTFRTNAISGIYPMDAFGSTILEGSPVSFAVSYADADNEAPSSLPSLIFDGVSHPMAPRGSSTNYVQGVTYSTTLVMPVGQHTYSYAAQDGHCDPCTVTAAGSFSTVTAPAEILFADPVEYDATNDGLPSNQWHTDATTTQGPTWHVVNTPYDANNPLIYNAPDQRPGHASVSLWFGSNATRDYSNKNQRVNGSITTPGFDVPTTGPIAVRYWTYADTRTADTTHDLKTVSVVDDAGVHPLATLVGPAQGYRMWQPVSASLNAYAGKHVRLMFSFDSLDAAPSGPKGWFINELLVGADRDNDGIPDRAEQWDVLSNSFQNGAAGYFPADGSAMTVTFPNAQASRATSAVQTLWLAGNPNSWVVTLNDSAWNPTTPLLNHGSTGPGSSLIPLGTYSGVSYYVLQTSLGAAGLPLSHLETPDTLTLRMSSTGGALLIKAGITTTGRTDAMSDDTDGDGVVDGSESWKTGTGALRYDSDADGQKDRVDQRPWTYDQPPVVTEIRPVNGDWSNGMTFVASSSYGVYMNASEGSQDQGSYLLTPRRLDATRWQVDFPANPAGVILYATDEIGNAVNDAFTFSSSGAVQPSQLSVAPGVALGGGVQWRAAAQFAFDVGARASLILVGITLAEFALTKTYSGPDGGPYNIQTVNPPVTPVVSQWNLGPGMSDCAQQMSLLSGWDTPSSRLGAYGMMHDWGYSSPGAVAAAITTAISSPNHYWFKTDAQTGDLVYLNSATQTIQKWRIHLDAGTCSANVEREDRYQEKVNEILAAFFLAYFGLSSVWELAHAHTDVDDPPPVSRLPQDEVIVMDAKANHTIVGRFSTWLPDEISAWANPLSHGSVEQQILMAAWWEAGTRGAPAWYWQNPSRNGNSATWAPTSDPDDLVLFMNKQGVTPAFHDWGASHKRDDADYLDALAESETSLCPFVTAGADAWLPSATYRYGPGPGMAAILEFSTAPGEWLTRQSC